MPPQKSPSPCKTALPRLPFGDLWAGEESPIDPVRVRLALHPRSVRRMSFPDSPHGRLARAASLQVGGQEFAAVCHTPLVLDLGEESDRSILIPRHGATTCSTRTSRFTARAGHGIAFLSGAPRVVESGVVSLVAVRLDSARLIRTAEIMHGDRKGKAPVPELDRDRELSLHAGGLPMDSLFGHLFEMFDLVPAAGLAQLGLDDLFYRYVANLMCPELMRPAASADSGSSGVQRRREIDTVCEYVRGRLPEPVTLTELESVSGLSQRSLQLAFQKHFGCTPTQWIRQIRLDMARQALLKARPGDTVTKIALDCGFAQLGGFSQAFLSRFGELPSDTLRQVLTRS